MKTCLILLVILFTPPAALFGQGSLTPSGTPGPTMKSLDQIEARTPISSLPFVISSGGSYYLTKSLNISSGNAITIAASGVNLDLNGFEITSSEASPSHSGILINSGLANIRITNGQIRGNVTFNGSTFSGSGFANGIQTTGSTPTNAHVSDVAVSGCLSQGINLSSGLVESCTVNTIGGTGISADNVIYCEAYVCGSVCISAYSNVTGCNAGGASTAFAVIQSGGMVTDCYASGFPSTSQATIAAQIARDCYAIANGGAGDALYANTAENCNGFAYGTGSGIHCYQAAINCYGTSSGTATAIKVTGGIAQNCYAYALGSGTGLVADMAINCEAITGNSSGGNGLSVKNAENCYGSSVTGYGIVASGSAKNCYGTSSTGIFAEAAENCTGLASSGYGVEAVTAANCYGAPINGSTHILTGVLGSGSAFGCHGDGGGTGIGVGGDVVSYCTGTGGSSQGAVTGSLVFACDGAAVQSNGTYYYYCRTGPTIYP